MKFRFLIVSLLLTLSYRSPAQTGIPVPSMSFCDNAVTSFMNTYGIPGATFALAKDGKLVYLRAFGNPTIGGFKQTQPYNLFRIGSLSKPITSIAIMKLIESGNLGLNDTVFGVNGILKNHPIFSAANITDNRIYNITVKNLLEHSAGWNRDLQCFPNPTSPYPFQIPDCDPILAPLYVAQQTGMANPASKEALIKFSLQKGLDFTPGSAYNYSNIGYAILGEIIAAKSGMSYAQYVKNTIFAPLGICDIQLGKNLLNKKLEREAEYIGSGFTTLSSSGNGQYVPWEYGGTNFESYESFGGWVATASDLVKLLVAVDGFSTKPDILNASTIATMTTPSTNHANVAKGWFVDVLNNWWHTGALEGSSSYLSRTYYGFTWAIIFNRRITGASSNNFWNDMQNLPLDCIINTSAFPNHDLMLNPTLSTTNINFTNISHNSVTVNWTPGNGDSRILVCSKSDSINTFPLSGTNYTSNSSFGSGSHLGNNDYVVYSGNGSSATVNNLDPNSTYFFRVYEFNKNNSSGNYALYRLCDSEQQKVNTSSLTALNEDVNSNAVNLIPNPAQEKIQIGLNENFSNASIKLLSVDGKVLDEINQVSGKSYNLNIAGYQQGVYFLEIISKNKSYRAKFIKM